MFCNIHKTLIQKTTYKYTFTGSSNFFKVWRQQAKEAKSRIREKN